MEIRRLRDDELQHHGVKGQRWGVRRYQNADGSLTADGKKRYYKSDGSLTRKGKKEYYTQHFENQLKNKKTKSEKEYLLRSEARKQNQGVRKTLAKGLATSFGGGIAGGTIGGVLTGIGSATVNPILTTAGLAVLTASAVSAEVGFYATVGATFVKAYTRSNNIQKLADLSDKYDLGDIKVRGVTEKR